MPAKPPPQTPSDPIDISDFSLGIFGDYHGGNITGATGSVPANGAATIANTFACCADQTGALVPLPAQPSSATKTQTFLPVAGNTTTANRWASNPDNYLTDACVLGRFAGLFVNTLASPLILMHHRFWWNSAGTGVSTGYFEYSMVRMFGGAVDPLDVYFDRAATGKFGPSNAELVYGASLVINRTWSTNLSKYIGIVAMIGVSVVSDTGPFGVNIAMPAPETGYTNNDTAMSSTGATPAAGNWMSSIPNAIKSNILTYPSPTDPAGNAVQAYLTAGKATGLAPTLAVPHQARVVMLTVARSNIGGNGDVPMDQINYTAALDLFEALGTNGTGNNELIGEENISGVGTLISVEADELLIVKHANGGYLVRGDLNNPTVQRLSQIESTAGIASHAVNTPIGVVYGSRNGVFVWAGASTSRKLSTQIEGFFWEYVAASDPLYYGHHGRFGYWHPWVLVPNNYIYDTRTGGWWRLADPATRSSIAYSVYGVDPNSSKMYAFNYKQTSAINNVYDVFDATVLASAYSWQSQPLVSTRERLQNFQQIMVVASPGANVNTDQTFTITLSGFDHLGVAVTPVVTTFTMSGAPGSQTQIQLKDIVKFQAQYVTVRIQASGGTTGGGSGVAPKLHSIKFMVSDAATFPKS